MGRKNRSGGIAFSAKFVESSCQFKPQLDLALIPATGDVKIKSKVRVSGVDSQAEMKMQVGQQNAAPNMVFLAQYSMNLR